MDTVMNGATPQALAAVRAGKSLNQWGPAATAGFLQKRDVSFHMFYEVLRIEEILANRPMSFRDILVEELGELLAGNIPNKYYGICGNLRDRLCARFEMISWENKDFGNIACRMVAFGCVGFTDPVTGEMVDEPTNTPITGYYNAAHWKGDQGKSRRALVRYLIKRLRKGFQPPDTPSLDKPAPKET